MRFNLSTLRKIAARAKGWRNPPHFRSPMEEALCSQARTLALTLTLTLALTLALTLTLTLALTLTRTLTPTR